MRLCRGSASRNDRRPPQSTPETAHSSTQTHIWSWKEQTKGEIVGNFIDFIDLVRESDIWLWKLLKTNLVVEFCQKWVREGKPTILSGNCRQTFGLIVFYLGPKMFVSPGNQTPAHPLLALWCHHPNWKKLSYLKQNFNSKYLNIINWRYTEGNLISVANCYLSTASVWISS